MDDTNPAETLSPLQGPVSADQPEPISRPGPAPSRPKQQKRDIRSRPDAQLPRVTSPRKNPATETKAEAVVKRLRGAKGVTLDALVQATGWQPHSVRGFLSGTVKKKLGLPLINEVGKDGVRRYRIDAARVAG